MKKYIRAGALFRRTIRRFLLENDINFIEEKGWIDSVFYLKVTDEEYIRIIGILNKWNSNLPKRQWKTKIK